MTFGMNLFIKAIMDMRQNLLFECRVKIADAHRG